jgi:D-glucosaminate-6-phosphate ammonia-lyase
MSAMGKEPFTNNHMNRRNLIRTLGAMGLAAELPLDGVAGSLAGSPGSMPTENIFRSIGVEPIINCRGTFTIIGGSIERPEVRAAMEAASQNFIQYDELAEGIGRRLSELTGAEWGMVSSGCAAGLKHVTAACVTGGDPEKLIRIPDLTGFEKTEVVVPARSRNTYDHSIRNIGVRIVDVSTPQELADALSPRTALVYMLADEPEQKDNPLSLETIVALAKPRGIPVLVDCAAEVLTIPNVHLARGATIVAYSGGKAICGPQCAGLLLGDKAILSAAWQASAPHHGPGRDNKVGREEMIGMLAAVETWTKRDHAAEWKRWLGMLAHIQSRLASVKGMALTVTEPTQLSNKSPVLSITWNPDALHLSGEELAEELGRTPPRIAIGSLQRDGLTGVQVTTGQMQDGDEKVVAERLYEALTRKRNPRPELAAPLGTFGGDWDVSMEFLSGKGSHRFQLRQDGNWLSGVYHATFQRMAVEGYIDGDKLRLRCTWRQPGNQLVYIFIGTLKDGKLGGDVHLGEYRTARFTAIRSDKPMPRRRFIVPGGPPLAT